MNIEILQAVHQIKEDESDYLFGCEPEGDERLSDYSNEDRDLARDEAMLIFSVEFDLNDWICKGKFTPEGYKQAKNEFIESVEKELKK